MGNWKEVEIAIREIVVALGADEMTVEQYELLDSILREHERAAGYFSVLLEQETSLHDAMRSPAEVSIVSKGLPADVSLRLSDKVRLHLAGIEQRPKADSAGLDATGLSIAEEQSRLPAANLRLPLLGGAFVSHAAAAISAVLLLVISGWASFNFNRNDPAAKNNLHASTQIVSMSRCIWGNNGAHPSIGQMISTGQSLTLLEGIAEFEVGHSRLQSTTVRICGPATVFVSQDGMPKLAQGLMTLSTHSLSESLEFPTPAGNVVVSEWSSLGISVEGETTSIHVFQGSADVLRNDFGFAAQANSPTRIVAGQAATFHAGIGVSSPSKSTPAQPEVFAFTKSLSAEKLGITDAYRQAILDSKPAIYWQFEDHLTREFVNHGTSEGLKGRLRGDATSRRFADNRLLEFGLSHTVGAIVSDGLWPDQPLSDYSVELWMKASHYHYSAVLGLVDPAPIQDKKQKHGFFFGLYGPHRIHSKQPREDVNTLRFVHRSPVALNGGTECNPASPYSVREWQHVVLRKSGSDLNILVNGEIVSSAESDRMLPANLLLVIGQLYATSDERSFTGQIDEVALYEHALTNEEIKRHYQIGKSLPRAPEAVF